MQQNLRRLIESWNIVENSEKTFDLPKVQDFESVMVELDAVVTLATGGSAVKSFAPAQLLKSVEFIADGKDVLDQVPFYFAAFGNYKRRFASEITAPANATAIAHTVRAVGFLDRANVGGWRPKDTNFQAYLAKLLQLRVRTGLGADLFTGSPVGSVTSGTVKISVLSVDEVEREDGSSDRGEAKRVTKRTKQQYTFAGANSDFGILLPVGNHIRLVEVCALDSSGNPSATALNGLKFAVDGVDVRFNTSFKSARSINAADLQVPIASVPAGFAVIDSSPRGKFSDYYHLHNASEAKLSLDVAAACTVDVVVEEDIAA